MGLRTGSRFHKWPLWGHLSGLDDALTGDLVTLGWVWAYYVLRCVNGRKMSLLRIPILEDLMLGKIEVREEKEATRG